MVSGDHSRVGWIKLITQAFLTQLFRDFVNPLSDDECRALSSFGKEIPHGAAN